MSTVIYVPFILQPLMSKAKSNSAMLKFNLNTYIWFKLTKLIESGLEHETKIVGSRETKKLYFNPKFLKIVFIPP